MLDISFVVFVSQSSSFSDSEFDDVDEDDESDELLEGCLRLFFLGRLFPEAEFETVDSGDSFDCGCTYTLLVGGTIAVRVLGIAPRSSPS